MADKSDRPDFGIDIGRHVKDALASDDDFSVEAKHLISELWADRERLRSRLSVSCQRTATRIATLKAEKACTCKRFPCAKYEPTKYPKMRDWPGACANCYCCEPCHRSA